jgi:hypothetical protein
MVETFTPAVCGSRPRRRVAIALFSLGALLASAALGAALGFAGGLVGTTPALVAAAVLAALAALRETGILRVPLPQSRRQVPERWRSDLPLPVWSAGYGVGLGLGVLTFQPVATFWVACGAALALGRPAPAACCFALYGAGRAFMAAWPYRRGRSGPAAVERLVARSGLMARANVVILLLTVLLLALAPAAGAGVTSLGSGFDPSAQGGALARARMANGTVKVIIQPPDPDPAVSLPGDAPSLDGNRVAYADVSGITVYDWRGGHVEEQVHGNLSDPALDYPLLAYRKVEDGRERLVLVDLEEAGMPERSVASVPVADDLGRPSLRGHWLAWHRMKKHETAVLALNLETGKRRTIRRTRVWQESNPSVTRMRIIWVEQRPAGSYLRMRRFSGGHTKTLMHVRGRKTFLWTTGLSGRTAYVTRFTPSTRKSVVLRVAF